MRLSPISWREFERVKDFETGVARARQGRPSVLTVHDPSECLLSSPIFIGGQDQISEDFAKRLFSKKRYWSSGIDLIFLPKVYYFTRPGHIVFGQGHICTELDYALNPVLRVDGIELIDGEYRIGKWHTERMAQCRRITGANYLMYPKWNRNYTHWHTEALIQLRMLNEQNISVDNFILPSSAAFQRASLEVLQNSILNHSIFTDEPIIYSDIAILSTHIFARTHLHPSGKAGLEFIRQQIPQNINIDKSREKLIYISRRDSKFRPLQNEIEFEAALKNIGFQVILGSMLTYAEQTAIFRGASVIIGLHGSGLTNMIYAQPEALVLELRPQNAGSRSPFIDLSYWIIASLLGNPYGAYVCPANPSDDDWVIDIDAALQAIRRVVRV